MCVSLHRSRLVFSVRMSQFCLPHLAFKSLLGTNITNRQSKINCVFEFEVEKNRISTFPFCNLAQLQTKINETSEVSIYEKPPI